MLAAGMAVAVVVSLFVVHLTMTVNKRRKRMERRMSWHRMLLICWHEEGPCETGGHDSPVHGS